MNTPAGIYTLTLTDNNGYTVVKNIQVNGEQPVIASIAASVKTAEQNQEVTFIGAADNTSTYSWIFGDESTATGSRVTHIYQNEGIYNVVMNAVNASGCTSQVTQTITVTSRSTTGVTNLNGATNINVWSNNSLLYVDFTQVAAVEATIDIYDVLGQKLYSDRYTDNAVYMKQITNIEVGYILVRVKNNNEIITKKVFISNDK